MDHYDVIIIGTGAGGGTLAHRLAPSGKKILLLERGGYLPREPENWDSEGGLRPRAIRHHRALVRQARRRVPPARPVLRRRQHQGLRGDPVPPSRARLRARSSTTAASPPPGRSPTPTSSPTTPRPSGSTSSTARPARTRPSRRAPARSRTRPSRTSRASSSCTTISSRTGHRPVPSARSGSTSTNPTPKPAAACAATASTASPA